ncbi:MAG: PaaX family transcriptional regulator C-terminal domain-containing protein [Alphaproteobacteria bacterium]|nr:PaaX family transcriptional regulator C-terminal domain-containing protein [Alphaproteobacteria bacterium]
MNAKDIAKRHINEFSQQRPLRAGSFIITLYGDAILPRNGEVWMGDIIQLCDQVGINESLVRTAMSRLVSKNRIVGTKQGRKSYYRLSDSSRSEFHNASPQIYSAPVANTATWTFVLNLNTANREDLKRKMERIGFGDPVHGLFAKPGNCENELYYVFGNDLKDYEGMIFTANLKDVFKQLPDPLEFSRGWNLEFLREQFDGFIEKYAPLHAAMMTQNNLEDLESLLIREILVHEYRRIIFKYPRLPHYLLPENYPAMRAFEIFSDLYRLLLPPSETYINTHFENDFGNLRPNEPATKHRLSLLRAHKS